MVRVRIGEGSAVALIVFLWLLLGFLLAVYVAYGVGFLYILISFLIAHAWTEVRTARFNTSVTPAFQEKHYSVGPVSVVVLRGPVKITARRVTILLVIMFAGFAVLLLLAFEPTRPGGFFTTISLGVLLILAVVNLFEVRWRKTDVG